jgi:hypothetical protein
MTTETATTEERDEAALAEAGNGTIPSGQSREGSP